jgi:hypothetical protein
MRRIVAAWLVLCTAALAVAQDTGTPPTIDIIRWVVVRGLDFIVVYDAASADPNLSDPAAIGNFLHLEEDVVTATLLIQDADWTPVDPTDPDAAQGEDVWVRFIALGVCLFYPPQAPPIEGADPKFFGRTADMGFLPLPGTNPPFATTSVTFSIPQFVGKNQLRLRGIIPFDVQWRFIFAAANEETPELTTSMDFLATLGCPFVTAPAACPRADQGDCLFLDISVLENPIFAAPNPPPFADAGADQLVAAGTRVILDASRTFEGFDVGFDPGHGDIFEKDILRYTWQWISGPVRVDPVQEDATDPTAEVVLPQVGTYVYRVSVHDQANPLPSQDSVTITVVESIPPNRPPRAAITGPANSVLVGSLVVLDGRGSTDPDLNPLTYYWQQVDALGGHIPADDLRNVLQPLSGVQTSVVTFQATRPGQFFFRLIVSDGQFTAAATFPLEVIVPSTAGLRALLTGGAPAASDAGAASTQTDGATATPRGGAPGLAGLCGAGAAMLGFCGPALLLMRRRIGR